jgi:hypothetical protein
MLIWTASTEKSRSTYLNLIRGLALVEAACAAGLLALTTRGGAGGGFPLPDRRAPCGMVFGFGYAACFFALERICFHHEIPVPGTESTK